MNTDIYTPQIEERLIQYYQETLSKYFNKLKPFINYTDEVKDLFIEDALIYCKSRQHKYSITPSCDGSNTPFTFLATILRNTTLERTMSLLNYLDSSQSNHQFQVEVNGHIWKGKPKLKEKHH
jgi:hypothetical protein